jgi:hypothetical protein
LLCRGGPGASMMARFTGADCLLAGRKQGDRLAFAPYGRQKLFDSNSLSEGSPCISMHPEQDHNREIMRP